MRTRTASNLNLGVTIMSPATGRPFGPVVEILRDGPTIRMFDPAGNESRCHAATAVRYQDPE